jgi:hypothetical protein
LKHFSNQVKHQGRVLPVFFYGACDSLAEGQLIHVRRVALHADAIPLFASLQFVELWRQREADLLVFADDGHLHRIRLIFLQDVNHRRQ